MEVLHCFKQAGGQPTKIVGRTAAINKEKNRKIILPGKMKT